MTKQARIQCTVLSQAPNHLEKRVERKHERLVTTLKNFMLGCGICILPHNNTSFWCSLHHGSFWSLRPFSWAVQSFKKHCMPPYSGFWGKGVLPRKATGLCGHPPAAHHSWERTASVPPALSHREKEMKRKGGGDYSCLAQNNWPLRMLFKALFLKRKGILEK